MQGSAHIFECAAPLNGRRGSPTTTRLLCITANSPSPGSYSAVVCKESDHSRSLSSPLSGGTATKRTHLPQRLFTSWEKKKEKRIRSKAPVLKLITLSGIIYGHLIFSHGGSMKTQAGFSSSAPGKLFFFILYYFTGTSLMSTLIWKSMDRSFR